MSSPDNQNGDARQQGRGANPQNLAHGAHKLPILHSVSSMDVQFVYGGNIVNVTIPAKSHEEAHNTLATIGQGGLGTGINQTYLGQALPKIRSSYYSALESAEKEIAARKAALGGRLNNPVEYRQFVAWASGKRTTIARIYRVPSGGGAVIGGEIRDNLKYGPGGRTLDNLVKRGTANGLSEEQALAKVLATVDKPNVAVTESVLRGAKFLKAGGAVFFLGGAAVTGYEIYKASPEDRPELVKKEAFTTGGSLIASDLAVGVALMVGVTGIGLIAVGVVAGVAATYGAEQLYYAHRQSQPLHEFAAHGVTHVSGLSRTPLH